MYNITNVFNIVLCTMNVTMLDKGEMDELEYSRYISFYHT